jgi:hypothetical protein
MSTDQNAPRDVVEGGPERGPEGQDEPRRAPRREDAPSGGSDPKRKVGSPKQGDVPPWHQPDSGQPGASRK